MKDYVKKHIPTGTPVTPATETGPVYSNVKFLNTEVNERVQMPVSNNTKTYSEPISFGDLKSSQKPKSSDGFKRISSKNVQESENLMLHSTKPCDEKSITYTQKIPKKKQKQRGKRRNLLPEFEPLSQRASSTGDDNLSWIIPHQQSTRTVTDNATDLEISEGEKQSNVTIEWCTQSPMSHQDRRTGNASKSLPLVSLSSTPEKYKTDHKYIKAKSGGYSSPIFKNRNKQKQHPNDASFKEQNRLSHCARWIKSPSMQVDPNDFNAATGKFRPNSSPVFTDRESQRGRQDDVFNDERNGHRHSKVCLESLIEQVDAKNGEKAIRESSSTIPTSKNNIRRNPDGIPFEEANEHPDLVRQLESPVKQMHTKDVRKKSHHPGRSKSREYPSAIFTSKNKQRQDPKAVLFEEANEQLDTIRRLVSLIQRIEYGDAKKETNQSVSSDLQRDWDDEKGSKEFPVKKPFDMQKYIYAMIEVMSRERSARHKKRMLERKSQRQEFDFNEYIRRIAQIKEKN